MTLRRQLAVASPLSAGAQLRAFADVVARHDRSSSVRGTLRERFDASRAVLTGSGTAALILALRAAARPGGTVAMPAYACVDLVAAARRAGVMVRLYDIEPTSLSPDMDSLREVVDDGVEAIVVVHLYGIPADVPAVLELARKAGIPVIEDAAQHAGARLHGKPAGSMGDLVVLSFGRGKGTTSGRGGALLVRSSEHEERVRAQTKSLAKHGSFGDAIVTKAAWLLGRPSLYWIPSAIPALHLGETVYHEAGEPDVMSRYGASLLASNLQVMDKATAVRRRNAFVLRAAADSSRRVQPIRPIDGAEPGYLRFPVLMRGEVTTDAALGITRAYPRPLSEEPEIAPILRPGAGALRGAIDLARRLVTLPTHHMVNERDNEALTRWMGHER